MLGGVLSVTNTMKVVVLTFPRASMAEKLTGVVPTGKLAADAGPADCQTAQSNSRMCRRGV